MTRQSETTLRALESHVGGLIRLKSIVHWVEGQWTVESDEIPVRICLLLGASSFRSDDDGYRVGMTRNWDSGGTVYAQLHIEGSGTCWILLTQSDFEFIK
jgi:hypothetical protein